MKKILLITTCFALTLSCDPEISDEPPTDYKPLLMARSDLEKSIELRSPTPIRDAGKIYRKDHLLFINEKYEGIHIYDNADPENPEALAFLKIPGNVDIAINNNIIYADNSVDLISLRYINGQLTELARNRNVFPEMAPPDFGGIPSEYLEENRPPNTVIVKWVEK